MGDETKRFSLTLDPELLGKVNSFADANGIRTTSKAIAKLLEAGFRELQKQGAIRMEAATKLAEDVNELDEHGLEIVRSVVSIELKRIREAQSKVPDKPLTVFLPQFDIPVSAGTGNYVDDSRAELVELKVEPPRGASYILQVSGDSMEPTILDGDLVYIAACQTANIGDIVVAEYHGDMYLKELTRSGLLSHNHDYPMIPGSPDIRIQGRYLGRVPPEALA